MPETMIDLADKRRKTGNGLRVLAFCALFWVGVAFTFCSCAGILRRADTLTPVAVDLFSKIHQEIRRGAFGDEGILQEAHRLELALETGDSLGIRFVRWAPLRAAAVAGIDDMTRAGEISMALRELRLRRLRTFDEVLRELQAREVAREEVRILRGPQQFYHGAPPPTLSRSVR